MSDHLEVELEHCNINPICFYNNFSLKLKDISKTVKFAELVKSEKKKSLHQKSKMENKIKIEYPDQKCISDEFENPGKKFRSDCDWIF